VDVAAVKLTERASVWYAVRVCRSVRRCGLASPHGQRPCSELSLAAGLATASLDFSVVHSRCGSTKGMMRLEISAPCLRSVDRKC
jgi:hypothetical protein